MVKLHGSMTHSRDADESAWKAFDRMIEPIRDGGRLEGLLAQFPHSFRFTDEAVHYVGELISRCRPATLAVEFRNDSWYEPGAGCLQAVGEMGAALVSVDLPALPGLPPVRPVGGTPFGYVRFHGRNAGHWWQGGTLRYDYGYSGEELRSWLPGLMELSGRSGKVFLFFNNCHGAQAVDSARMMRSLLEGET